VDVHGFEAHGLVRAGVARVTLAGELDLDSAPRVREAVDACLEQGPALLRLDLGGVRFCDCAGANALLRARLVVLGAGVDLAVEGIGPQPARLFSLIGADEVLTAPKAARGRVPAHG
jgi:anti-anti-sigma factor